MGKKIIVQEDEVDENEDNSEDEKPKRNVKGKEKGWNWTAIVIMLMFFLPALLAIVIQAFDYMYPEAAMERRFKERVTQCYEVANPTKISDVDKFIKKYKGKEHILFAQLRSKYGMKYPECNN